MRPSLVSAFSALALGAAIVPAWQPARAQESDATDAQDILLPLENRPDPIVVGEEVIIETYEGTSQEKARRAINFLSDESAISHGTSTEFYKNGQKFSEGRFENGLRVGEWTFWYENGTKCKAVQFQDGVPHGEWTVNWEDGKRRATRAYSSGEPHGIWLAYAKDGETILEQRQFDSGLAHGKWGEYFASGKPHVEANYEKGKRHGKYTEWNDAGQIVREMSFKQGKLDGRVVVRGPGGREIVQNYRDGQLVLDEQAGGGE
jgi:antitoxin component YwqK of YwqJK toxin-antitoxin module